MTWNGHSGRSGAYAAELMGIAPDVLLAVTVTSLVALHRQTSSLPIVFAQVGDPAKLGVVASLALLQKKPLSNRLSRSGVRDAPSPFMDIELHQAFVSHFQQEGLASFFIHDVGAFHDLVHFERLLAERAQDIFSIIQHD